MEKGKWYRADTGSCDIYYFRYDGENVYLNHDAEAVIVRNTLHLHLTRATSEYGVLDFLYIPTELFSRTGIIAFTNSEFREMSEPYELESIRKDLERLQSAVTALKKDLPEVSDTESK